MTEEQITSRCEHCGGTRKEHHVRKPFKCPTKLKESYWKPWTVKAYEAAAAAGKAAAPVNRDSLGEIIPEPRTIDLKPNFGQLFKQFARDAQNAGAELSASICQAQFPGQYPEAGESIAKRAAVLRAVQGFIAPATIALQAATTVEAIEELRGIMSATLAKLDGWANEFENLATADEFCECGRKPEDCATFDGGDQHQDRR